MLHDMNGIELQEHLVREVAKYSPDGRGWVTMQQAFAALGPNSTSALMDSPLLEIEIKAKRLRLSDTGAYFARRVLNLQNVEDSSGRIHNRRDPDALTMLREIRYIQGLWVEMHDKAILSANHGFMAMEDNFVMLLHLAVKAALEEGFTEGEL
jgi:hypothetical protein